MRISEARDLEVVRDGITRWLRDRHPEASAVSVVTIHRPDAGLSAETLFVDAELIEGRGCGTPLSLVVRLPPAGDGLFPAYDLSGQGSLQANLATAGIPAVAPVAVEEDESWIGAPFLVMPRVAGRTVRNDSPFLRRGWLAEATAKDQARLHDNLLGVLARLHQVAWDALDWDDAALRFLRSGAAAQVPPAQAATAQAATTGVFPGPVLGVALERWAGYLAWAGDGETPPTLDRALSWCRAHLPVEEPPSSVLWGDVQLGNMVIGDDMDVAAILDFELASIGPAEMDLAWFLVLHSMTVSGNGGDLPGFPDRAGTLARYEVLVGRPLHDLRWYEVFAALRSGAIMVRAARLLAQVGIDDTWLTNGNPVMAVATALMEE